MDYIENLLKNKVMNTEAPEKIYLTQLMLFAAPTISDNDTDIEYTRTDAFIKKAKKWFEKQNEWFDPNGNRHCDLNDFEDFRKYMEGE